MTMSLFKSTTSTARNAAFFLKPELDSAEGIDLEATPSPDPRDLEQARLEDEIRTLTKRLHTLQAEWDHALEQAREQARKQAACEHVRNDADVLDRLERCLDEARAVFARELRDTFDHAAVSLATAAARKLVDLNQNEEEWLGRLVARRVEQLATRSVLAIHFAAADGCGIAEALKAEVAAGLEIKLDPSLAPSTARIVLRVGEIEVSPKDGAQRLLDVLEEAGDIVA